MQGEHWGQPPPASFSNLTMVGFTGHESDGELGLVNMKGRIYDPKIGRFLTTDPIVSDPLSGQSWNAYSYVVGNPLTLVDPSGFDPGDVQGGRSIRGRAERSGDAADRREHDREREAARRTRRARGTRTRVKDNGVGVPAAIRGRIFEPFFTTKPAGLGTGLGLPLGYDVVRAHGGTLAVESEAGAGATFIVTLPADGDGT